jgi:hypothetical protein
MKTVLCGLAAGWLAFCIGEAGAQPIESFTQVLTVKQQGGEGLQRVLLPAVVYQGSARADLGDLRMFNARGEQVPFAYASAPRAADVAPSTHVLPVFPLTTAVQGSSAGGDTLSLQVRQQKDGTLISLNSRFADGKTASLSARERRDLSGYIVDASRLNAKEGKTDQVFVSALVFDWEVTDDSRSGRVRIETSSDLKSWSTLILDGALVDLEHDGQRLTLKRVEFVPTGARYLRLTWAEKPFVLKSVAAEVLAANVPPILSRQIVNPEPGKVEGLQPGEYAFDLGGRLPVRQVRLILPEPNSVAPVRIFARSDLTQPWRQVDSATFYRLNRDGAELVSPAVKLSVQNERFWKIAVDARVGGLGRGTPQLEVAWQPQSIIFAARGEGPYRMAWGNAEAIPAHLSLAALMPGYRSDSEYSLPLAETGEVTRQTVTPPSAFSKLTKSFTWKQAVLWLVLLVGVGLLGMMAWRLNTQMSAQMGAPTKAKQDGGKDAS